MSRRKAPVKAHQAPPATRVQDAKTTDSFANFASSVGYGTANQSSLGGYSFDFVSRNRVQMEAAYRSSWICGKAVDLRAEDMTREGIEIRASDLDAEDIENLERAASGLRIWPAITSAIKWSRLYGGAIAVMLIDGQKPETPLRLDTIKKDQFKGLLVLDRWVAYPVLNKPITELGPDMGKPEFYTVQQDSLGLPTMRIHHSRVIRLEGVELPYWQRIAENLWGQSVLERLWDRLLAFDSTTQGAAQLVYKAHLRTYKIEGLRDIIAAGGQMYKGLVAQIELIRQFQSNEGLTLMDAKDSFEAHSYTFAGLDNVLMQFSEQVAGALEIPLVLLFGQSPAGFSDGDANIRNYYDSVKRDQESQLRPGIGKVYNALFRSTFGKEPPENFDFVFRSLWQMSDTEKAEINSKNTTSITGAFDSGIIGRDVALKELRASSQTTGVWSNITDEMVTEAENEPPPVPEGTDPNADPEDVTATNEKQAN